MSNKSRIELPNLLIIVFLVPLLFASCASAPGRMTGAALQGDAAALDGLLRPGAADINASSPVGMPQAACPGEAALTPLQAASCAGHAAIVKKLLDYKADPNLATRTGKTPLFLALTNGRDDVVRILLQGGAKPDTVDAGGNTALMVASMRGNKSLVEFLLKNGALPQIKNRGGETALMMASDVQIAQMLISAGSDPLQKNNDGESARHIAERKGNADTARFFRELEEKSRQAIDKELAGGDKAAEGNKFDEALSFYAAAVSKAAEVGGRTERDVRVKVIKSVNDWAIPPGLSAKAREHLVRSSYILKNSQDFNQAEKEIAEALRADPWWLEGYYNLGLMQAKSNQFEVAERNLSLFIAAAPAGPKPQAAQDKIYEIRMAKEEAGKIRGVQGIWVDSSGLGYNVAIDGNKLRIVSNNGLVFTLALNNNVLKGSVEGKANPGPHKCILPGQIHPVNGKLDPDAKGISLEYLWSSYDTRFHCVNMFGAPSANCCLMCDEVCDAVNIVATNTISLRLARSR